MDKYIFYLLFLTIPFANISIGGHIYPVEIPLLFLVFSTINSSRKEIGGIRLLDALVIIYAVFSLVSVVAGADAIYESARHYRLMILTPTLLYLVIRYSPQSLEVMRKGIYLMLPGILVQGILLTYDYILYGERPVGVEGATSTITASLFFAIGLGIMLFGFPDRQRGMMLRIARYAVMGALFGFLVLASTRASMIGFLIFAPLASYAWKKQRLTKLIGNVMVGLVVAVIALILTSTVFFSAAEIDIDREEIDEIAHSSDRLFSVDLYVKDIGDRMRFWGRMGRNALENPIMGSGAARATVGRSGGTVFHIGSAHNILISVLITTGIIGLTIFVLMIRSTYGALGYCQRLAGLRDSIGKVVFMGFSIILLVALTNDLSGGRVFVWFVFMALASRLLVENTEIETDAGIAPPTTTSSRIIARRRKVGVTS